MYIIIYSTCELEEFSLLLFYVYTMKYGYISSVMISIQLILENAHIYGVTSIPRIVNDERVHTIM